MWTLLHRLSGRPKKPTSSRLSSELGRIQLRPIQPHQIPLIGEWFEDLESCRLAFGVDAEEATLKKIAEEYLTELLSDRTGVYLIHEADSSAEVPIGFLRYRLYKRDRRKIARLGIMLGRRSDRGKGLGSEAMRTLLHYLFTLRDVDSVELDTATFNQGARRCFERCGFRLLREVEVVRMHGGDRDSRYLMRLDRHQWAEGPQDRSKPQGTTLQR